MGEEDQGWDEEMEDDEEEGEEEDQEEDEEDVEEILTCDPCGRTSEGWKQVPHTVP